MRISAREFELLVKETHLHEIEEFQKKNKRMTANFVYHDVHSNFHHQCLKIDNLFLYNIG